METLISTRPFRFGSIANIELRNLVFDALAFQVDLNNEIDLSLFTSKLESIFFIPVYINKKEENIFHEEEFSFLEKKKEIKIQKKVSPSDDLKAVFITELEKFIEVLPELEAIIIRIKEVLLIE